jgi:2-oxoglutarate ferredoxin oxidoreductase subunit beta
MLSTETYRGQTPAWCPGCGNFPILKTFKDVMVELGLEPHQITIVSGIGQAAKLPHYTKCNTFNGLHGRALPVATGIRLANAMPVIVMTGDGDCYGEGGNHPMAMRRNIGVKLLSTQPGPWSDQGRLRPPR